MKKLVCILTAAVMALSLSACGKDKPSEASSAPAVSASQSAPPESSAPAAESGESASKPESSAPESASTPESSVPEASAPEASAPESSEPEAPQALDENGVYTTKEDVALYIYTYGKLPQNFITKKEARALGWEGGSLEPFAPGKSIGGDTFGNYEGLLPEKEGRRYTECDIDTLGASSRGAKRIVFSNDGLIYYTDDHYESFVLLYGEE